MAKPHWTKTPPRKEGWYWHKGRGQGRQIVWVIKWPETWGFYEVQNLGKNEFDPNDKWSGPLVPPKN